MNVLVKRAIAGIEAGNVEIRPVLSNLLKGMSRIALAFVLRQKSKMSKPQGRTAN